MKIPKRFKLFGHTIEVEYMNEIHNDTEIDGLAINNECKIFLLESLKQKAHSYHEKVFWHEVIHHILDHLRLKIDGDIEQTVDSIAQCLNQIINSFEYDDDL